LPNSGTCRLFQAQAGSGDRRIDGEPGAEAGQAGAAWTASVGCLLTLRRAASVH
jgi:hypothetical protein